MRTTVTLDPDTEQVVRRRMAELGVSFKVALNSAIRDGASGQPAPAAFRTQTSSLGVPRIDLDRALLLAADLENAELVSRQQRGS